jgi:hypothetical protein
MKKASTFICVLKLLLNRSTQGAALNALSSIMRNFFGLQYSAKRKKNIPIKNVDHELDKCIAFLPDYVKIYMDFSGLWIRTAVEIMEKTKDRTEWTASGKEINLAGEFIEGITLIYERAAEIYKKHLSTTNRPKYSGNLSFITIHLFDPHLMCIPSLHVMVMIYVIHKTHSLLNRLNSIEKIDISELKIHAMLITDSVLYVKQHSVNCIAAAMYAMNCIFPALFTEKEAGIFAANLFIESSEDAPKNAAEIRTYILTLFHTFIEARNRTYSWEAPLLQFLQGEL